MTPAEGERAHLAFLAEEFAEETRRHERVVRNLTARRARAEARLALALWKATRPPDPPE